MAKEKKWFIWEKIRRVHPMQNLDFLTYMSVLPEPGNPIAAGVKYENRNVELLAVEKDFDGAGKKIAKKVVSDPQWFSEYLAQMDKATAHYFSAAEKILKEDLQSKSNAEISSLFRELHNAYLESHKSGVISIPPEFRSEFVSNNVKKLLEEKIKKKNLSLNLGQAFALLSQPQKESVLVKEKRNFLKILGLLLQDKNLAAFFKENSVEAIDKSLAIISPEFDKMLSEHREKYQWIFFMYEGPAIERAYFVERLKEDLESATYLASEHEKNAKLLAKQKRLLDTISGSAEDRLFFSFPRRLIETKAYRKDSMYFGSFVFDKLCSEIGKRLGLTVDQVRYMQRQEVFYTLEGKFKDFELLKKRMKYSVFYALKGERTFLVGAEARKWYKENVKEEKIEELGELKGTSAFAGLVEGKVKVINHPNEMNKMEKRDILVSHSTNPNLLPAMVKAAAIVTDVGGITCHAAIVSREFKIPCVVGTKIATQGLKDNDLVEVDAEKGIVRKVKK